LHIIKNIFLNIFYTIVLFLVLYIVDLANQKIMFLVFGFWVFILNFTDLIYSIMFFRKIILTFISYILFIINAILITICNYIFIVYSDNFFALFMIIGNIISLMLVLSLKKIYNSILEKRYKDNENGTRPNGT